jgi:hypothetical protein
MWKQDTWVDTGQSTAYCDGKIYYVSQENGQDGVYSMNPDGTGAQFVCSVPKITRLIARKDCLYYAGVRETYKGVKLFGLFSYDFESSATEEIPYTDYPSSVYDAYVTEDGTAYVLELGNIPSSYAPRKLLYIYPKPDDMVASTIMTYGKDKCEVWRNNQIIYIHEDSVHQDNDPKMEHANFIDEGPFSFLEPLTGTALMDNLSEAHSERYFKALLKKEDVIWCAMGNTLLKLNTDTAEINDQYSFDEAVSDMNLTYLYMNGNTAYIIFEKEDSDLSLAYSLNLVNSRYVKLTEFNKEKILLHIEDNRIYWAEDHEITCSALSEKGIGDDIYKIKMPENIVKDNIFETAGDWLLIYRNSRKADTETNQLLYKINLDIQAVIKVGG